MAIEDDERIVDTLVARGAAGLPIEEARKDVMVHYAVRIDVLTRDRDMWKARAESAELACVSIAKLYVADTKNAGDK